MALKNLKKLRRFFIQYNVFNYAAQLSYSLMLALLPLLMVCNWALRLLSMETDISIQVTSFIETYLPDSLSKFIAPMLENQSKTIGYSFASIIANIALIFFVFYAAARLMRSIRIVTTGLCDMHEDRNFIKLWALAFRDLFITLIIISSTVYFYVEARIILVDFLKTFTSAQIAADVEAFWNRLIIVYIGIVAGFTLNWYLSKFPARPFKYWHTLPGTIFIFVGWEILFRFVNLIHGFLNAEGAVAIVNGGLSITITIYFISLIFVIGELLNFYLEQSDSLMRHVNKTKATKSKHVKFITQTKCFGRQVFTEEPGLRNSGGKN